MEPEQREALRRWRVELVENINIQDGLYTQLMSRNVLNSRTVNRIKNNKPPEQQVEDLLDELQKKDCFEKLCEALIADGQEHIVNKFLKLTKKLVEVSDPVIPSVATSSSAAASVPASESMSIPSESTDSLEKTCKTRSPSIVIRKSDNRHVYISYNDEASPTKRLRATEADTSMAIYVPGETRYAMKHYVSEPLETSGKELVAQGIGKDSTPALVLDNPQTILLNGNISDPHRYMAAFIPQSSNIIHSAHMKLDNDVSHSMLPAKDSPSKKSHEVELSTNDLRNLLRPSVTNTHQSLLNHISAQNRGGQFVKLSQDVTSDKLKVSHYNTSPNKYSCQLEMMTPSKGMGPIRSMSPPVRDPGFLDQVESSRSDYVDTMALKDSVVTVGVALSGYCSNMKPVTDSKYQRLLTTVPDESMEFPSKTKHFSSSSPPFTGTSFPTSPDLEDIDLPDGCVNVKVEHCSQEFFYSNYKKSYPMRHMPRGWALIINVNKVEGKPARMGTNFDRDNLCNLLSQLHFNILVYNDDDGLSAQEMVIRLRTFAKKEEHYQADACFICLLSHGEEEYIFGTDGKRIPLNEIFMLFDNNNCKGLIGKPKVFIIQACRGDSLDRGVVLDETDGGSLPTRPGGQLPSMSDMLICYPTLQGYFAWRNRARGSWYIEAIIQIFMRYARNEDVCAMLNRVNHLVSKKVSESLQKEMNQMSQMSEYKSTLRYPHLYLFPGIAIRSTSAVSRLT